MTDRAEILRRVASGHLSVVEAELLLERGDSLLAPHGDLVIDLDRERRCGMPEVVFCESKSPEQIATALELIVSRCGPAFGTRCTMEQADRVGALIRDVDYDPVSRTIRHGEPVSLRDGAPVVGILHAGTSDLPVAREAERTLETFGWASRRFADVGVAGLSRLYRVIDEISACDFLIVAAGMEGALPSVVAGLVDRPVVGLPTSVGYGAAEQGRTAMMAMLTSCASGLSVVNVDNGFGAAAVAIRGMRQFERTRSSPTGNSNGRSRDTVDGPIGDEHQQGNQ